LAPKIAWTPEHFFRFRKYWPYNGGVATDLLYHKLAPLLIAMAELTESIPTGSMPAGDSTLKRMAATFPDTFLMTADYPTEWALFLVST